MDFTAADLPVRIEGANGQRFTIEQVLDRAGMNGWGLPGHLQQERLLVCSLCDARGYAFWQLFFTPAFLLQVRDLLGRVLNDARQPPVKVQVSLVQMPPPAPLELPPTRTERLDIDGDVDAIKRRMLEGR